MPFGFYPDRTMLMLIPAILIALWAQSKVSSTYRKYKAIRTMNGYTGEQVARMMLDEAGLPWKPGEEIEYISVSI